jgi:hypothetical protein
MKTTQWVIENLPDRQDLIEFAKKNEKRRARARVKETSQSLIESLPHLKEIIEKTLENEKLCEDTTCLMILPRHKVDCTCIRLGSLILKSDINNKDQYEPNKDNNKCNSQKN